MCQNIDEKQMGSRLISEYIWMPKSWPNEYLNVFRCPTKDQTDIKIYSVLGKATITNKKIYFWLILFKYLNLWIFMLITAWLELGNILFFLLQNCCLLHRMKLYQITGGFKLHLVLANSCDETMHRFRHSNYLIAWFQKF